ncbi:MAG: CPBP family intramembrane metalloprotease [Treponema sp.]|nr:CPBP family intramembrane metalloprotease [Treponema sp.]
MGIYIESAILYILLFFSGPAARFAGGTAGFSAAAEILKLFFHLIPSLALIWYILFKTWKLEYRIIRPGKKDIVSGLIALPCLLLTGFAITFVSAYFTGASAQAVFYSPVSAADWIVLCFVCIFAAYLEESFFRFYLLSRRQELNLNASSALVLSVALFSICHINEGPWGFLNAALCGTILGFIFLRYNSLHGIAVAHALYNITVYIINAIIN